MILEPDAVAVRPVGTEGIEIALVPVPESGIEVFTVPRMFRLAERLPIAAGVNLTTAVHELDTAMVAPLAQVPPELENSLGLEPVRVKYGVESTSEAVPTLEMVMVCEALVVPVFWLPKVRAEGLGLSTGAVVAAN